MIQTEKAKLKVNLPERFSGGLKDNYEEFEKKLRTYLCLTDSTYALLLKWAVEQGVPITTDMIKVAVNDSTEYDAVLGQLQLFLYYALLSLIEGSAQTIIEQVEEENGLEA